MLTFCKFFLQNFHILKLQILFSRLTSILAPECPAPKESSSLTRSCTDENKIGSECKYECNGEHVILEGSNENKCDLNGVVAKWDPPIPDCKRKIDF